MERPRPRASLYLEDRAAGMKYKDIAQKHGVSYQSVAQACAQGGVPGHTKPFNSDEVIYPALRKWLNENKVNRPELARRIGELPVPATREKVNRWLRGKAFPRKQTIDRLIELTGLTYELLFSTDPLPVPDPDQEYFPILLNKNETMCLMGGLITYLWRMEDNGIVGPGYGYEERKELLEKMRKFERANFPEEEVQA